MHGLLQICSHIPKLQSVPLKGCFKSLISLQIHPGHHVRVFPGPEGDASLKNSDPWRASEGHGPPRAHNDMSKARPIILITLT